MTESGLVILTSYKRFCSYFLGFGLGELEAA